MLKDNIDSIHITDESHKKLIVEELDVIVEVGMDDDKPRRIQPKEKIKEQI